MSEQKCWLVVREDLDIPAGKLAVQSGHAFMLLTMEFIKRSNDSNYPEFKDNLREYFNSGYAKIVVKTKNLDSLLRIEKECLDNDIIYAMVEDEGRTVFPEKTKTCIAIGPSLKNDLPKYIQRLQLY